MSELFIILLITRAVVYPVRDFYPFIRKVDFCDEYYSYILTVSMLLRGSAISLVRYARYMQTYVLFQYSILRNIVSKTNESLIRRVINLAFRFAYISHPVAVYTPSVIYVYTAQCSLPFQYSLNNVSSINSITLSASRCCLLSKYRKDTFCTNYYHITIR